MRWVPMMVGGLAAAGVIAGSVVAGVTIAGQDSGPPLPPARARVYANQDACLLTGPGGISDPPASQTWAGLEDASEATSARVSYLAVTGPATESNAETFLGSLLVRGCQVIVASGTPERAAVLAEAGQFTKVRFVVDGDPGHLPPNVTALTFATSGQREAVASAVESGI